MKVPGSSKQLHAMRSYFFYLTDLAYVEKTGEVHTRFWRGRPEGKSYSKDLDVNGKIILTLR